MRLGRNLAWGALALAALYAGLVSFYLAQRASFRPAGSGDIAGTMGIFTPENRCRVDHDG
jgi:hypothetical protein